MDGLRIYKICAEGFQGAGHLKRIQEEAQTFSQAYCGRGFRVCESAPPESFPGA
jgi:hypothetical protein